MSRQNDVRAFVTRHTYLDVPMWRVAVFADEETRLYTDFVVDWDAAMRLANATVASVRRKQLAAKRNRYSRLGKMRNHRRMTLIHAMRDDGTFPSMIQVAVLKAYRFLPEELGLRLEFTEGGTQP